MTTSDRDPTEYAFQHQQHRDTVAEEEAFLAGPGDREAADYDYAAVARALAIGPDSSVAERTIDITTLGARSGTPRRVEVWFHRVGGRWYLTGMPIPAAGMRTCGPIRGSSCISSTASPPTCPRLRRRSTSRHGGG